MTIYFKLSEEQAKAIGCPDNTWIAVFGVPPNLEAFSSTHLYECRYADVRLKLAKLSGQEWFIKNRVQEWGDERVKELLERKPIEDV